MKKSIIILSAMTLIAFTSCNTSAERAEDTTTAETTEEVSVEDETVLEENTTNNPVSDEVESEINTTTNEVETPNFDNQELQEYMDSYDAYVEEYKEAMKSKDMTAMQNLASIGEELSQKAQAFNNLSEADQQKLAEYLQKQAKEMQEIAMEAANQ